MYSLNGFFIKFDIQKQPLLLLIDEETEYNLYDFIIQKQPLLLLIWFLLYC